MIEEVQGQRLNSELGSFYTASSPSADWMLSLLNGGTKGHQELTSLSCRYFFSCCTVSVFRPFLSKTKLSYSTVRSAFLLALKEDRVKWWKYHGAGAALPARSYCKSQRVTPTDCGLCFCVDHPFCNTWLSTTLTFWLRAPPGAKLQLYLWKDIKTAVLRQTFLSFANQPGSCRAHLERLEVYATLILLAGRS